MCSIHCKFDLVECRALFSSMFLILVDYSCVNCIIEKKNQLSKVYTVFFIVYQVKGYQNILKLSWILFSFTSYNSFLKNKKEVRN